MKQVYGVFNDTKWGVFYNLETVKKIKKENPQIQVRSMSWLLYNSTSKGDMFGGWDAPTFIVQSDVVNL